MSNSHQSSAEDENGESSPSKLDSSIPDHSKTADQSYDREKSSSPRSLYLHVPFCRHRCGYCNFTLVAGRDHLVEKFLDAVEIEIASVEGRFELDTLFLGGGTPSHLKAEQLGRLRTLIDSRFSLSPTAEVTAECNPNDLNESKASALANFGVNRISLGVPSLNSAK